MYQLITALLASSSIALASQTVFSVHDDLLAFPQYEVVFSDALISDTEVSRIVERSSSIIHEAPRNSDTTSVDSQQQSNPPLTSSTDHAFDPAHETYELMYLNGEQHLCTIPIVDTPLKNETSDAEVRAAEQKELARATDRGWELLQGLEGSCMYFISGFWSYSFCYNNEITQFHQLPTIPGKPWSPPQPDPREKQFVLGRTKGKESKENEWGDQVEVSNKQTESSPKTELQMKGDTRYLVQKMEGGTTCDLTGKPRRVEVQFHCNPAVQDRIGYIKEVTTCSYLMVIYTARLCSDAAFQTPKENKAHSVVCRVIVPEAQLSTRTKLKELESELAPPAEKNKPINIGGVILGGGKWISKENQRMPIPASLGQNGQGKVTEVIVRAKSKEEGGKVEQASNKDLKKLDLDPTMVENLKKQVQKMAKEKGWKIEVVDEPGQVREILAIVDGDEDDEAEGGEEGSEEVFYKDEL